MTYSYRLKGNSLLFCEWCSATAIKDHILLKNYNATSERNEKNSEIMENEVDGHQACLFLKKIYDEHKLRTEDPKTEGE
jgi:hypothetical protein